MARSMQSLRGVKAGPESRDREPNPLRAAVRWVAAQRRGDPHARTEALLAEAGMRFGLPPVARGWLRDIVGGAPEEGRHRRDWRR
jgi:hypothetical protein